MLLMAEKGIRGGICHANTWNIMMKIKNHHILRTAA